MQSYGLYGKQLWMVFWLSVVAGQSAARQGVWKPLGGYPIISLVARHVYLGKRDMVLLSYYPVVGGGCLPV